MKASDVIQFLQANPAFFDDNSTLLTELTVTHPHTGQAISLTERQLIAMRERIAQLENKFAELLEFGEENDAIGDKVHRFCVSLLEAEDFESIRQAAFRVSSRAWSIRQRLLAIRSCQIEFSDSGLPKATRDDSRSIIISSARSAAPIERMQ